MKKEEKTQKRKRGIITPIIIFAIIIFFVASTRSSSSPYGNSCLSMTFDDGLANHYTTVYPLLKQRGFTATFFVPANQSNL